MCCKKVRDLLFFQTVKNILFGIQKYKVNNFVTLIERYDTKYDISNIKSVVIAE